MNNKKVDRQIAEQVDFLAGDYKPQYVLFNSPDWASAQKGKLTTPLVYGYMFYCLGNILSLYGENFFCLLHTNRERHELLFHLNHLPPKQHMKFFREQIKLQVAPASLTPGVSTCSFFSL